MGSRKCKHWICQNNEFHVVFLVVFLVLENIGIFNDKSGRQWISWLISAIIAILSTAYIAPADILSLMTSYTALGLTITTLIPLALLIGFTYQSTTSDRENAGMRIMQYLAWIIFLAYSVYRFLVAITNPTAYSQPVAWIVGASAVIALFFVILNAYVVRKMRAAQMKAEKDNADRVTREAAEEQIALAGARREKSSAP